MRGITGIHIGASDEAVKELSNTIMKILENPSASKVKNRALQVVEKATQVEKVSLMNCSVSMAAQKPVIRKKK